MSQLFRRMMNALRSRRSVAIGVSHLPRLARGGLVGGSNGGVATVIGGGRYDEIVTPLSPDFLDSLRGVEEEPDDQDDDCESQ